MNILNSTWLISMLEKSGKKPKDQLLSLFTCLENWLEAPGIREQILEALDIHQPLDQACPDLHLKLVQLATKSGVAVPHVLVNQIFILVSGALQEEIRNPGSVALTTARHAASAILEAAIKKPSYKTRWFYVGSSVLATILIASGAFMMGAKIADENSVTPYQTAYESSWMSASPLDPALIDAAMLLQSKIEAGNCPAPQLLIIPREHALAYNAISTYQFSEHPAQDAKRLANFLAWYKQNLESECYYPSTIGPAGVLIKNRV